VWRRWHTTHQRPPSFPTRRSSDLEKAFTPYDEPLQRDLRRDAKDLRATLEHAAAELAPQTRVSFQTLAAPSAAAGLHEFASSERSEEHTSELQSRENLVCRLLLEK